MWTCGPWTLADQGIQWGWEAGRGFQGHTWLPPSGFSQGSRSQHEGSKQGTRAPPHQGGAQDGVRGARGGLWPVSRRETDGGGRQNAKWRPWVMPGDSQPCPPPL